MTQSLTVHLPSDLYVRIKKRADDSHRTIESEALDLLASTLRAEGATSISAADLHVLDNSALECAANSRLPSDLATELELLHFKKQREGLTDVEILRSSELIRAYERSMLVRAEAVALLKKRGVDIGHLAAKP